MALRDVSDNISNSASKCGPRVLPPFQLPSMSVDLAAAIERLRLRLLDLGGRNRLLNFRHTKKNAVRFVDEVPDTLFSQLLDGVEFTIAPLPITRAQAERKYAKGQLAVDLDADLDDPAGRDLASRVAREHAIPTDYALPLVAESGNARHTDRFLQTLLFPEDLGALLRRLHSEAELAIQETGSNMLYLALGFLEWYESDASSTARFAPLVLLPASLSRGDVDSRTREFKYKLQHSGEDFEENLSLRERLKQDFAIELPALDGDRGLSSYFTNLQEMCETRPRWRVHAYASLSLFSFGKILMYRDLDDAAWPSGQKPSQHQRVKELLRGTERTSDSSWAEDYDVDEPEVAKFVPLTVDEADGSQLSALVDIERGRNLVIEGPPGTGKSQTIANLIAAAIQKGKKVLFVAEKLAALEVVRHRLNKVGLGDFCLELHSHKTKKRQVLDDIEERLERRRRSFDEDRFANAKRRLAESKRKLRAYSELINARLEPIGISLFDAMWKLEALRTQLGSAVEGLDAVVVEDSQTMTAGDLADFAEQAENFAAKLGEVLSDARAIEDHPWWGVRNERLTFLDRQAAENTVSEIGRIAAELEGACLRLDGESDGAMRPCTIEDIALLEKVLSAAGVPETEAGRELARVALSADTASDAAAAYRIAFQAFQAALAEAGTVYKNPPTVTVAGLDALSAAARNRAVADEPLTIRTAASRASVLEGASAALRRGSDALSRIGDAIGLELPDTATGAQLALILRRVLSERPAMRRGSLPSSLREPGLAAVIVSLKARRDGLVRLREDLARCYDLSSVDLSLVRSHFRVCAGSSWWETFGKRQRAARRYIREMSGGTIRPGMQRATQEFGRLRDYLVELGELPTAPLLQELGVQNDRMEDIDFDTLLACNKWFASASLQLDPYGRVGSALLDRLWDGEREWLDQATRALEEHAEVLRTACGCEGALSGTAAAQQLLRDSGWRALASDGAASVDALREFVDAARDLGLADDWSADAIARTLDIGRALLRTQVRLIDFPEFEAIRKRRAEDAQTWERSCAQALAYVGAMRGDHRFGAPLARLLAAKGWEWEAEFRTSVRTLAVKADSLDRAVSSAATHFGAAGKPWFLAKSGNARATRFAEIAGAASRAATSGALVAWCDYLRASQQFNAPGRADFARLVERGHVEAESIGDAARYVVLRSRVRAAFAESPELDALASQSRDRLRQQFAEYDRQLLELTRSAVAYAASRQKVPAGQSVGRVGDLSELALLDHERAKQRRHIPLRQLMRRAGNAIVALKPCFMMGPLSVAQYLAPGGLSFDLVVMDEASQLKTEDALGAILRGSQLVVVGDRMQLPPTSFFDKVGGDEDTPDDEADLASQAQSVLEAAAAVYRPARMLKWHYRSRHANLISFSNVHFYRGNLIALPPTAPTSPDAGVTLVEVADGLYERGTNVPEAKRLVQAVVACIENRPTDSIGVAAMNAAQAEVIEELFEKKLKSSETVRRYVETQKAGLEPFFVKNLENVQGDERDVIFVSATYGRGADGRVLQRFGPINGANGHRRLNVLFSRARKRLLVFASMGAEDIVAGPEASPGIRALRDYLAFARTGVIEGSQLTGRAPDSDFEVAVATALKSHGYEVAAQVGSAGYFIDLAVRSRRNREEFLLAIECDGKTYHSTRSARDRDRLRQQVLEGLGWRVHRVWSTDWFRQPEHEIARVLRQLEEIEAEEATRAARWMPAVDPVLALDAVKGVAEASESVSGLATKVASVSEDAAREALSAIAERARATSPADQGALEFLREAMVDALLRHRPISKEEFLGRVPFDLRIDSDGRQVELFLEEVLSVLRGLPRR